MTHNGSHSHLGAPDGTYLIYYDGSSSGSSDCGHYNPTICRYGHCRCSYRSILWGKPLCFVLYTFFFLVFVFSFSLHMSVCVFVCLFVCLFVCVCVRAYVCVRVGDGGEYEKECKGKREGQLEKRRLYHYYFDIRCLVWFGRRRQKVGLATAPTPYGPWTRFDDAVMNPSGINGTWDKLFATNPAASNKTLTHWYLIHLRTFGGTCTVPLPVSLRGSHQHAASAIYADIYALRFDMAYTFLQAYIFPNGSALLLYKGGT